MFQSPSGKAGVCKTPIVSSILTWNFGEKSSNGRTPPFEGVYLGSSPSFSASWVGVIGNILVSKTKVQSSSLWPFAKYPGNSVEECFATNEEDGGSNPSQGAIKI